MVVLLGCRGKCPLIYTSSWGRCSVTNEAIGRMRRKNDDFYSTNEAKDCERIRWFMTHPASKSSMKSINKSGASADIFGFSGLFVERLASVAREALIASRR